MSTETYDWVKAAHQLGFTLWVGSMFALTLVLTAHARGGAAAREAFIGAERSLGRAMEMGALLTIACGIIMILGSTKEISPLKQPYLHIKLTLAVFLIAAHGLVRARMGKLARGSGEQSGTPAWLTATILLLAMGMIWLAVVKPMLRG